MGNRWQSKRRRRHGDRRNRVRILSLGQEGQLIGTVRPGTLKVLVGTNLIDVPESDLQPLDGADEAREQITERTRLGKGARLGKFRAGPMFSTTLDLHGLTVRDALEVVGRKLNRALLADVDAIRIIQPRDVRKLARALHEYLSSLTFVTGIEADEDNPDVTWVRLKSTTPSLFPPRP